MAKRGLGWRGVAIAGVSAFVVAGAISFLRERDRGVDVEEGLQETAALLQEQLPQQVDEVTTWTDATAEGTTLTYHYILAGSASDYAEPPIGEVIGPDLLAGVCGNADMVQAMGMGVRYVYSYVASDGGDAGTFAVEPGDCGT